MKTKPTTAPITLLTMQCVQCKKTFIPTRPKWQVACSTTCRNAFHHAARKAAVIAKLLDEDVVSIAALVRAEARNANPGTKAETAHVVECVSRFEYNDA